jgi:homocysteine S-methyltransferase
MINLLEKHPLILMEAAISEPIRRADHISLHPDLSVSSLIYDEMGRYELERLYNDYVQVGIDADLPFVMFTPTWRANFERVKKSGMPLTINADAYTFMNKIRDDKKTEKSEIVIGGMIGCKNDCYKPQQGLSVAESEQFHSWQIIQLAKAGVDFLIAETLPNINEATGIAKAMSNTGLPYVVSFVVNREGYVLDGTDLLTAFTIIDSSTRNLPVGYMVNCSYPTFLHASEQPAAVFDRLIGCQANASSLDHNDLDGAEALHAEDVKEWGAEMLLLNRSYGVRLLGGCCGTGVEHLKYIVEH